MYTQLVTGDVPGASTYFNPLLAQTIIPCTTGTRPSSPNDGMMTYETDAGPGMFRYREAGLGLWRSPISAVPLCILTKSSATISTGGSPTTITNWSELNDDWNMYPATGSVITVPYTGTYMVTLTVRWASQTTAAGLRSAYIFVNGTEQMAFFLPMTSSFNSTNAITPIAHPMQLTASDQIEGKVFQSSGGNLDIIGNTRICVQMLREG